MHAIKTTLPHLTFGTKKSKSDAAGREVLIEITNLSHELKSEPAQQRLTTLTRLLAITEKFKVHPNKAVQLFEGLRSLKTANLSKEQIFQVIDYLLNPANPHTQNQPGQSTPAPQKPDYTHPAPTSNEDIARWVEQQAKPVVGGLTPDTRLTNKGKKS